MRHAGAGSRREKGLKGPGLGLPTGQKPPQRGCPSFCLQTNGPAGLMRTSRLQVPPTWDKMESPPRLGQHYSHQNCLCRTPAPPLPTPQLCFPAQPLLRVQETLLQGGAPGLGTVLSCGSAHHTATAPLGSGFYYLLLPTASRLSTAASPKPGSPEAGHQPRRTLSIWLLCWKSYPIQPNHFLVRLSQSGLRGSMNGLGTPAAEAMQRRNMAGVWKAGLLAGSLLPKPLQCGTRIPLRGAPDLCQRPTDPPQCFTHTSLHGCPTSPNPTFTSLPSIFILTDSPILVLSGDSSQDRQTHAFRPQNRACEPRFTRFHSPGKPSWLISSQAPRRTAEERQAPLCHGTRTRLLLPRTPLTACTSQAAAPQKPSLSFLQREAPPPGPPQGPFGNRNRWRRLQRHQPPRTERTGPGPPGAPPPALDPQPTRALLCSPPPSCPPHDSQPTRPSVHSVTSAIRQHPRPAHPIAATPAPPQPTHQRLFIPSRSPFLAPRARPGSSPHPTGTATPSA